ncbi:UvrD-helicase domain-containing protein [Saliterribacillus persicus]|uniref:DNA helicase-2/ATP-dependent DNA helicase PcrA n=1 Tax=Saliterribacillus persicus TaxID=930114 RepID=A0A368XAW3_9BACI|nr:UvrD-helicase domain-containing protein [Saliterribacillus persicus]RCW63164.1 DNA helicase-2/ATP-dependent DNA helicase PcrA [Saliterribacillus persicus]
MSNNITVDEEIFGCMNLDNPKSFFLFAGAGSGKTRSLVEVLKKFRKGNIDQLRRNAQKVAIITYTNVACDEIKRRLEFDSAFQVSTIHSFAWGLIKPYTNDIKEWLREGLKLEVKELIEKQDKAKSTSTKTYADRASKIDSKTKRIKSLDSIRKFTYNPNGDNTGTSCLNHSEVINIAGEFINNQSLLQSVLVRKYPILLIDESQDTKKELVDAFFEVQKNKSGCFTLGMFGDSMQRIYTDGKIDLDQNIPDTWAKPAKTINYRCPKRITALINKIRSSVDGQEQIPNKDYEGNVRLFVVDARNQIDKNDIESEISNHMAELSGDNNWNSSQADVKVLTLEHHMAARRGGFSAFFAPLYAESKLKTGLLDGTLQGVSLFANQILPLIKARQSRDDFAVARIARKYSPLLRKEALQSSSNSIQKISETRKAVDSLFSLWSNNSNPSLNHILREVYRSGLFQVPEALIPIAKRLSDNTDMTVKESQEESTDRDSIIDAWDGALECSFNEFKKYVKYINDESQFGTHQGIKGLEFPRVMVVLDDEEAKGFLFSYEKLFGAKAPSETDVKNKRDGKETSIERTRRLFYVTCSRAEKDLAIVAYTKEPEKVNGYAVSEGWFEKDEVITR